MTDCEYCDAKLADQSSYEQHINRFHRGKSIKSGNVKKHGGNVETKVDKQIR